MKIIGAVSEKQFHVFDIEQALSQGGRTPRLWVLAAKRSRAYVYSQSPDGLELIANARPDGDGMVFMHDLAQWLEMAEKEDAFDHLVLAAPAGTLADIRDCLSPAVYDRVLTEREVDLTSLSVSAIETWIATL